MWSLLLAPVALAQDFLVEPYLQQATPTSVWVVWETDAGEGSEVGFGTGGSVDRTAQGTSAPGHLGTVIHEVQLTGLDPDTVYTYEARTGGATSTRHTLRTPADPTDEAGVRLVAVSDMQRSSRDPDKWGEVVNDGVIPWVEENWGGAPHEVMDGVVIPGDLVDDGWVYDSWADEFFAPAAPLLAEVPSYPVIGNHEQDSIYYFQYFHLPDNGTEGFEEHWWWHDVGNVRLVGLDSNSAYARLDQLEWLEDLLGDTCEDPTIDFVFAQLHHPHHSELWRPGESPYTGRVIEILEAFSTECGKPSVHFFGHTHGYSRGASRDHAHLMVNVATAGGAIDYWGEYPQADYDEFAVSTSDWGFVAVDVAAGADPSFTVTRVSRGDNDTTLDNVVTDEVTVRRFDTPPDTPVPYGPTGDDASGDCVVLEASAFSDLDGDAHQASHWQVAASCDDFSEPVVDAWRQDRDLWYEVDRREGRSLVAEPVSALGPGDWCWRVRYRDDGLAWSEWSEPAPFSTAARVTTDNLLRNGGAEDILAGWTRASGSADSVSGGVCEAPPAQAEARAFALDSACMGTPATLTQEVDLPEGAPAVAHFSALLAGDGATAQARLVFVDAGDDELGASDVLSGSSRTWAHEATEIAVPEGAATLRVELSSTGEGGAWVDDVTLVLGPEGPLECQGDWPAPEAEEAEGCGGCDSGPGPAWLAFLALLGLRRRR